MSYGRRGEGRKVEGKVRGDWGERRIKREGERQGDYNRYNQRSKNRIKLDSGRLETEEKHMVRAKVVGN